MASPPAGTDEHSIKLLGQACQGKVCKFAMIVKGDAILRLKCFLTGTYETQIQAAREEGHDGDSCWGVVSGSGADLMFSLSPADGFDRPPVEATILKAFLVEKAQLEVIPTFAFVDELPVVVETQDEEAAVVAPTGASEIVPERVDEPASAPAPEPAPEPTPEAEPEKPAADDEQDRATERDTRLKFIADSYRNLPTPLKFTLVDIAAGKCIKVTAEGRDTPEAMQSYRNLMSECADWIRSDESLEHRDQVTTIKALLNAAKAEFLAIQAVIT